MYIPIEKLAVGYALLSTASAFYPYERTSSNPTTSSSSTSRRNAAPLSNLHPLPRSALRSITLPLHLHRGSLSTRDNKYDVINGNDPKQKNSVAVDQDKNDISYMVAVTIGDSKEEYKLLLDSAASNTWVMGEDCTTEACAKHNLFGKSDSKTIKTDTKTFSITYGTGSVSGTTATDTIHIGTSLSTSLTFGIANNASSEFLQYPMDGIIGMGRGTSSSGNIGAPQIVEVLSNAKLISAKLYGLHLGRAKDGKSDGELNLGEVNKDLFDGDLNWLDTVKSDRGFWEVPIADAGYGGKTIGLKDKVGIIDTGTSFFFMPPTEATALHKLIDGSSQSGESYQVPCTTTTPITLKFGSTTYNMSSADWVGDKNEDSGLCNSKIIGRKTFGENQWLIGDAFLKNVYTAFDFDKGRVGFGVKSGNTTQNGTNASSATPSTPSGSSGPTSGSRTGNAPAATSGTGGSGSGSGNAPAGGSGATAIAPASAFALSIALGVFAIFV